MLRDLAFYFFEGVAQFDVYKKSSNISVFKALKTDVNVTTKTYLRKL